MKLDNRDSHEESTGKGKIALIEYPDILNIFSAFKNDRANNSLWNKIFNEKSFNERRRGQLSNGAKVYTQRLILRLKEGSLLTVQEK